MHATQTLTLDTVRRGLEAIKRADQEMIDGWLQCKDFLLYPWQVEQYNRALVAAHRKPLVEGEVRYDLWSHPVRLQIIKPLAPQLRGTYDEMDWVPAKVFPRDFLNQPIETTLRQIPYKHPQKKL